MDKYSCEPLPSQARTGREAERPPRINRGEGGAEGGRREGESDEDEDENTGIDGGDSDGGEDSAEENDQQATERTYFRPEDGLGENIDDGNDVDEEDKG